MQQEIKKNCFKHKNSISGVHHSSVFNYRQYWKQYLISWVLGTSNFSWCFQQRDSQISIIACLTINRREKKKKRHRNLSTFKVIILVYRASTFLNNLKHKNKSLLCETENLHENLNCSLMTASPQWSQYQKKNRWFSDSFCSPGSVLQNETAAFTRNPPFVWHTVFPSKS